EINPEIPRTLETVIERLHAKDPRQRFQTATEVAQLLGHQLAQLQQPVTVTASWNSRARVRRWAVAAAALLLLAGGLSVTEATGVTSVLPRVIRIAQGDGSLVVEVDDPQVKVAVEGDGGLIISGAGPHEVRLRPGSYWLRASRDGRMVREELVTILRGDRQ